MARNRRHNRNYDHRNRTLRLLPPLESRSPLRQLLDEDTYLGDAATDLTFCVGGIDHLESLDIEPIPPEEFDWDKVPVDQQPLVVDILTTLDIVGLGLFGLETETIVHRVIAIAASHPSQPLLRRSKPERLAAALTWIVLGGNQQFGVRYGRTAKKLWAHFNVGSCTTLAQAIAEDLGMWANSLTGLSSAPLNTVFLSDPGLHFAMCRHAFIELRNEIVEIFEAELEIREASKPLVVTPDGGLEARAVNVEVSNAFVGDSAIGERVVVGLVNEDDNLEMFSLSLPEANRLVSCVQGAITASGVA
jgi:hypothetical protein